MVPLRLDKKGIGIGIALLVVFALAIGGTVMGLLAFSYHVSKAVTIEVTYNEMKLIEDKLHFDSEKNFLENSLLVAGAYAAYKNGENGGLYNEPWDMCSGYVCWKDTTGNNIPPETTVVKELGERVNDTFESYLPNLKHTKILGGNSKVKMENDEKEFNFTYNITALNLTTEFLNHTIEEENVWINATVPIRHIKLYRHGKDFTENSESKLNNELINVLNHIIVCTGDGRLTEARAKELIVAELPNIANDLANDYSETEWELELLEINNFRETVVGPPHHYIIEFTVLVTVRDSDLERRVATSTGLEKLGIVFAINSELDFDRTVEKLCDSCSGCTGAARCGSAGSSSCSGSDPGATRIYWENMGATEDCNNCYCEKTENCGQCKLCTPAACVPPSCPGPCPDPGGWFGGTCAGGCSGSGHYYDVPRGRCQWNYIGYRWNPGWGFSCAWGDRASCSAENCTAGGCTDP